MSLLMNVALLKVCLHAGIMHYRHNDILDTQSWHFGLTKEVRSAARWLLHASKEDC